MKDQIEYLLDIYGYEKREYGWVRDNPKGTSQALTFFMPHLEETRITVQMFGWLSGDSEGMKLYDTGIIAIYNINQFEVLIEVFDQYKNIDG